MKSIFLAGCLLAGFLTVASGTSTNVQDQAAASSPVKIIFDTDIGNDVDDTLALCMLHALQTRGHCEILGVTITKPDELAGPFVDVIDTFYGRPSIPIGFVKSKPADAGSRYLMLANAQDGGSARYPHALKRSSDAPAAAQLLRTLLSKQADESVVMVQVGFFSNLAALLDTPSDEISPLNGKDLVKRKVRFLSVMAGAFKAIDHNNHYCEYNVINDIPAAQKLAREWPSPIVWSGFEIGITVPFPATSIEHDFSYVAHHPAAEAYYLYEPPPHNRPCWDLTSSLYAVFSDRDYFGLSASGNVTVEEDGFTRFVAAPNGRDRFLILNETQAVRVKEAFVQLVSEPPAGLSATERPGKGSSSPDPGK